MNSFFDILGLLLAFKWNICHKGMLFGAQVSYGKAYILLRGNFPRKSGNYNLAVSHIPQGKRMKAKHSL